MASLACDWLQPVSDVLKTLCSSGRVTLRKNQSRWNRVIPGFQALCSALDPATAEGPSPDTAATPDVARYANKLFAFASSVCAANASPRKTSCTFTLSGKWDPAVFHTVLLDVAVAAAAVPSASHAAAAAAPSAGTGVGAGTATGSILVPTRIPGTEGLPEPLVALLQIALLLRCDAVTCERVVVDADGSITLTLRNHCHDIASGSTTPSCGFSVMKLSHSIRFHRVLAKDALENAAAQLLSSDSGTETSVCTRLREIVASHGLMLSLWLPFPPGFVDSTSVQQSSSMPFPSLAHPKTITFHPLFRWHEDSWNSFHLCLTGRTSDALALLLANGSLIMMDASAMASFAHVLIDVGQPRIAHAVCSVAYQMLEARRQCHRMKEKLVFGGMSVLLNETPNYLVAAIVHGYKVRAVSKFGHEAPEELEKAVQDVHNWHNVDAYSLSLMVQRCSSLINEAQFRALGVSAGWVSLEQHKDFAQTLYEAAKAVRYWISAVIFTLMRLQRKPADAMFQLASSTWHSGTADVNWRVTPEYDDQAPFAMPPDHIFITYPMCPYGRGIAEASDATLQHVDDAILKVRHAYRTRRSILGPDVPATLKAQHVLDLLYDRRASLG